MTRLATALLAIALLLPVQARADVSAAEVPPASAPISPSRSASPAPPPCMPGMVCPPGAVVVSPVLALDPAAAGLPALSGQAAPAQQSGSWGSGYAWGLASGLATAITLVYGVGWAAGKVGEVL